MLALSIFGFISPFPKTWVPLASTWELDPTRPTPVTFLSQRYVCWKGDDTWHVADDACPHRRAPLSEGRRLADGTLECAYHGWTFAGGCGACTRIPQLHRPVADVSHVGLRVHPTRVHKSVLFAWPWPDPPPADPSVLEGVADEPLTYTRDLPYGWDTLLENLLDPSHIPFAHHGLQGTRDDAVAINMSTPVVAPDGDVAGFAFEFADRTMGKRRHGRAEFRAPFVVQYKARFATRAAFDLTAVCVPSAPGHSRAILLGPSRASPLVRLLPAWLVHLGFNRFLDSDLAFLHYQERTRGPYRLPAMCDRGVAALRNWLRRHADPSATPLPSSPASRDALFDRHTQHTTHCVHCATAQRRLAAFRRQLPLVFGVLTLTAARWPLCRMLLALGLATTPLVASAERATRTGGFEHHRNH